MTAYLPAALHTLRQLFRTCRQIVLLGRCPPPVPGRLAVPWPPSSRRSVSRLRFQRRARAIVKPDSLSLPEINWSQKGSAGCRRIRRSHLYHVDGLSGQKVLLGAACVRGRRRIGIERKNSNRLWGKNGSRNWGRINCIAHYQRYCYRIRPIRSNSS
jgi:hypothetical protein